MGEKTIINGNTYIISYVYDENGAPAGLNINGSASYFVKNVQGDILGIMSHEGTVFARYYYDAWGNLIYVKDGNGNNITNEESTALLNPFRYRGYFYDSETEFYYLGSRYYDPEIGRFLNADDTDYLGAEGEITGYNLFTYCSNNPVMGYDPTGNASFWQNLKAVGIEFAKQALVLASVASAAVLVLGAFTGTVMSGGAGAVAIPAALCLATTVVQASLAVAAVGVGAVAVGTVGETVTSDSGTGYSSFKKFKQVFGTAGINKIWHHIVEQCQAKLTRAGFSTYQINNTNNLIRLDSTVHDKISRFYSSIPSKRTIDTGGMVFRDWLNTKSFEEQYQWGLWVLRLFGVDI